MKSRGTIARLGDLIQPAAVQRAGEKNYPVLSMTMRDGLVDQADKFKKRIASADTSAYKVVRRHQLVVGFPIDEGVLAFQDLYDAAIVSPAYAIWDIKTNATIDRTYLQLFLRSDGALKFYRSRLRNTTARRRSLPDDIFLALEVPVPPLAEQERIVKLLDEADALRKLRTQADQRTATLIPALFHEMFGDQEECLERWPTTAFVTILAEPLRNGVSPSKSGSHAADVLTLSAITGDEFDLAARKTALFARPPSPDCLVAEGQFLICRGNGNRNLVGSGKVVPATCVTTVFPDTIIVATPSKAAVSALYLETLWSSHLIRSQIESKARTTNGTFKINQAALESVVLPIPPLSLQQAFAARVAEIRELEARQAASRQRLDALFQSMLHRAFNGGS